MSTRSDVDWQVIDRALAGAASAEDERRLRGWVEAGTLDREMIGVIRAALAEGERGAWDTDAAWRRVAETVDRSAEPSRAGGRLRWVAPAAAAAVLIAALWGVVHVAGEGGTERFTAAPGQRDTVSLADGSVVVLNGGSSLQVGVRPGQDGWGAELVGEAYFDVAPQRDARVVVRTSYGTTNVLGTRFSVRAYPDDGWMRTVVETGRVAVTSVAGDDRVVLGPGELARVAPGTPVVWRRDVDVRDHLAWTRGRLVVVDRPLGEVVSDLHRWLGVPFAVRDPALRSERLTVRMGPVGVEDAADAVAIAVGADWERGPDGIRFVPKEGR